MSSVAKHLEKIRKMQELRENLESHPEMASNSSISPLSFYLDYVNNYLTLDKISEDYQVSLAVAKDLIRLGRYLNEKKLIR